MSWEDQGRQEHGWFGNGTAPPKLVAGESEVGLRGADAASSAAAAAARAYAWAKTYGPVLFGLPRSGALLDKFADAVSRIERGRPGTLARALGEAGVMRAPKDKGATTVGGDLLTPARDMRTAPASLTPSLGRDWGDSGPRRS